MSNWLVYWTVLVSWEPDESKRTEWHPTEPEGAFKVLSRGAFTSIEAACGWAVEKVSAKGSGTWTTKEIRNLDTGIELFAGDRKLDVGTSERFLALVADGTARVFQCDSDRSAAALQQALFVLAQVARRSTDRNSSALAEAALWDLVKA